MGKKGRDAEAGREAWRCDVAQEVAVPEWMVPRSCVVDKNPDGYLGSEQSQTQARLYGPGR